MFDPEIFEDDFILEGGRFKTLLERTMNLL